MVAATMVVAAGSIVAAGQESIAQDWVATWSASPIQPGTAFSSSRSFENQTVRQIVHVSAGGRQVRIRLSNEYGAGPLLIGAARIALQATGDSIVPASDRALTFRGQTSIVIAPGAVAVSDSVALTVPNNANVAVSLYVPQNTDEATYHHNAVQTAYISGAGDFTTAVDFPTAETRPQRFWLNFVEVVPATLQRMGALAVFGDSFTEGSATTVDANRRPTDFVSGTLNPLGAQPRIAVLNQSTACARLLFQVCGPSGLSRFKRDVLDATGVTHVLLALGSVDLFLDEFTGNPAEDVRADQVIAGIQKLIQMARSKGLVVYGATFTPNELAGPPIFTPENEARRQAVNAWIRATNEFDAIVDFDAVVRDPNRPTALLPSYAASDGLHLNDAGSAAQGRAIVEMLR
jgi:lysophospholipase L1-like esterase